MHAFALKMAAKHSQCTIVESNVSLSTTRYRRKFRSIRRRKRKGFFGNRRQNDGIESFEANEEENQVLAVVADQTSNTNEGCSQSPDNLSNDSSAVNVSFEKVLNSTFEIPSMSVTRSQTAQVGFCTKSNMIVSKHLLIKALKKAAVCRVCRNYKSCLDIKTTGEDGLAEHLVFVCSNCKNESPFETSEKLSSNSRSDKRGGRYGYEVNRRSAIASVSIGYAGLEKFCSIMDLPKPMSRFAHQKSLVNLEKAAKNLATIYMKKAAEKVIELVKREEPYNINELDDGTEIANIAITIDGTWQRRGHSSKNGAVFAISVLTGEVLDFEILSKVCFACRAKDKMYDGSDEYQSWYDAHKSACPINHEGTSGDMEAKGACQLFLRSIEQRNLKYTTMVGDGDTGCYSEVCNAIKEKFGNDYVVVKEECVGHVQKRIGRSLREYKRINRGKRLVDGKSVGGAGRLTDKVIDSIQNYYGLAIRKNKGDLQGMKNAVTAILNHLVKDEKLSLEEQHAFCPKDRTTWCKYWKDQADKTTLYDESKRLPSAFKNELEPIFIRLSQTDLLERCLLGVTQNQNESLHSILWGQCAKTVFCGKRKLEIAACKTVCLFNAGATSIAKLMKNCNIIPGRNAMTAFSKRDAHRLMNAAIKVSKKYKDRRRELRGRRKHGCHKEKESYISGAFGITSTPGYKKSFSSRGKKERKIQEEERTKMLRRRQLIHVETDDNDYSIEPRIKFVLPLTDTFTVIYK